MVSLGIIFWGICFHSDSTKAKVAWQSTDTEEIKEQGKNLRNKMKKYQPYIPKEECVDLPSNWNGNNLSTMDIAKLAQVGGSFDFLLDEGEDIYNDYIKKEIKNFLHCHW